MPIPLPAAAAAAPIVAAAVTGPWWALPLLGLVTGLVLMYLTEWAKSKFGKPKTDTEILVARENLEGARRDDSRELLMAVSGQYAEMSKQNASILQQYQLIIVQNAENAATVKIQASEIDRLRVDVRELQGENATLKGRLERVNALDTEIAALKARISLLDQQLQEKTATIARLQLLQQQSEARAVIAQGKINDC